MSGGATSGTNTGGAIAPSASYQPGTITPTSLQPQTPANFQQPAPTTPFDVTSLSTAYDGLTAPQQQAQDTSGQLQDVNTQLAGKAAFQTDQYKALGLGSQIDANGNVVAADPAIGDLNAQLDTLTNQAKAIPLQNQNAETGQASQTGIDTMNTADLRTNAIKALNVSSLISARNNNLAHAQMLVDIATTQKFGPLEAQQKALTANLALIQNSPDYTNAEKKQAAQQAQIVAQQTAQLDIQKQQYQDAQNKVLAYATVATPQQLQEMQQASSPVEVAQIAAKYGVISPADQQVLADLAIAKANVANLPLDKQLKAAQVADANASAALKRGQASFYGSGGAGGTSAPQTPQSPAYQTPEGAALAQTPTLTGAPRYTGSDPTSINAQAILDGLNAPPTARSNTPANAHLMSVLNTLSMQQTGHGYDQQAAKAAYDFRTKTATPYFAKVPTAVSTISAIADLARQANVSNLSQLNDVVNTGRAAGWFATAAQQSAAKQLQSKLALNSDDLGLLLGAGQGSDSKIALASVIFDPNGGVLSTTDLANSVATTLEHKTADYATQAGIQNPTAFAHNLVQSAYTRGQQPNINYNAPTVTAPDGRQIQIID